MGPSGILLLYNELDLELAASAKRILMSVDNEKCCTDVKYNINRQFSDISKTFSAYLLHGEVSDLIQRVSTM